VTVAVEVLDAVALAPVAVELRVGAGRRVAAQDRRLERAARREPVGAVDQYLGLAVAVEVREAQLGEARAARVAGLAAEPAGRQRPVAPVMVVPLAAPIADIVAETGPDDALTLTGARAATAIAVAAASTGREYSWQR
jgi:hypothetical protein